MTVRHQTGADQADIPYSSGIAMRDTRFVSRMVATDSPSRRQKRRAELRGSLQHSDDPETGVTSSGPNAIVDAPGFFGTNRYPAGKTSRVMDEYEAVFEIDSETDAYAVERLTNRLYNSLREESRTLREGSSDSMEMLAQFEAIRDAARRPTPGKLTVKYESQDEEFEE